MSIPWAKILPYVQAYAPVVWRWWQRRKQAKAEVTKLSNHANPRPGA